MAEVTTIKEVAVSVGHRHSCYGDQGRFYPGQTKHKLGGQPHTEVLWKQFYEGLCHDHRRRLWSAHFGTCLARNRGRAASGDGTLVRSHHRCLRGSLPLGFALALALAAIVTSTHP